MLVSLSSDVIIDVKFKIPACGLVKISVNVTTELFP